MSVTAAPATATLPIRPPRWVRVWVGALAAIAVAVAVLVGGPVAASGRWAMLVPVAVVVVVALLLAWRIGGLAASVAGDGTLRVRNRAATATLRRDQVREIRAGQRPGRAATPCAVVVLRDGSEVTVDATLAAAFQQDRLDAQIAALRAWKRG
ncbi:hypothetical protein ACXR2U_21580 [Jatrophihabitans sp. YIM 134969]